MIFLRKPKLTGEKTLAPEISKKKINYGTAAPILGALHGASWEIQTSFSFMYGKILTKLKKIQPQNMHVPVI